MYGVVLSEYPTMIVMEMLPKGDLIQFLLATRYENAALKSNLAACLLQMSRDIAAGMTYLAGLSFIHRDLAARNVFLDKNLVCKIADFGLARDLDEENCYMGQISIRWTAPEVLKFFKYSLASDMWSYGVVLYEIWSLGERPYDCLSNKMVVENVEMGYRLPAPPGCPYAIYELMIECWHPDYQKRPSFSVISTRLSEPDDALLINEKTSEPISGKLGDCLEDSCQPAYLDLQCVYKSQ
ncbi:ephrin type-A receptor 8-like [Oscarella lobularis]|uniref:ephrin type-A receptor 8-like n=1 Tax=Oscarella lobularis TaxID=121494 RepID=UPI0033143D3F